MIIEMKKEEVLSGIYKITCVNNGKIYIGSAVNIKRRWIKHKSDLNRGSHDNKYLQNSWNKYSENSFIFEIVEIVEFQRDLLAIEQKWIDKSNCTNRDIGYNLVAIAGSMLGYKHSDESKLKNSVAKKGKKGFKHSEETKEKISKTNKGRDTMPKGEMMPTAIFSDSQVYDIKIKMKNGYSNSELVKEYGGVSRLYSCIRVSRTYKHILPELDLSATKLKRLSEDEVVQIKRLINEREKIKVIALKFGVKDSTIKSIKNGYRWKEVGEGVVNG